MDAFADVLVLATLCATIASFAGGFFAFVKAKDKKHDNNVKLLMGLAHDKLMVLGIQYVDQGWITTDEYDDLRMYLYEPYVALGGNGTASRIWAAVDQLPIRSSHMFENDTKNTLEETRAYKSAYQREDPHGEN